MKFFALLLFIGSLVLAAMSARIFREPIEADLSSQARHALDERGFQSVGVRFDHLDATLTGNVSSKELKQLAEEVIEGIAGARVTNNRITFGADFSPRLVFVAGQPVEVSGKLNADSEVRSLGGKFDLTEVIEAKCSEMPWEKSVGDFVEKFFAKTSSGRLEFDGRQVRLEGEVSNVAQRWALVDEADGMATDLDVIDLLTVSDPKPFEVEANFEGGRFTFRGILGDQELVDRFGSAADGGDVSAFEVDPASTTAPWLETFPKAVRPTLERGLSARFKLQPDAIMVSATFENEFWLKVAEQSLRDGLPEGVEAELNFSVAQKAVAAESGEVDKKASKPIKIMIAGDELRIEGRVRLKSERDRLLAALKKARPDLKVESALTYTWREPKIDSLRNAYPKFLTYVVSRIGSRGSVELHQDRWEVDAVSSDRQLGYWLGSIAYFSQSIVGIPCEVTVRSGSAEEGAADAPGSKVLEEFPIYFKPFSAQISGIQSAKMASLAIALSGMAPSDSIAIVGFDRGDGSLAKQRARAVRRSLVEAGLPFERFTLRAERVPANGNWKDESVVIEIQDAPAVDEA